MKPKHIAGVASSSHHETFLYRSHPERYQAAMLLPAREERQCAFTSKTAQVALSSDYHEQSKIVDIALGLVRSLWKGNASLRLQ